MSRISTDDLSIGYGRQLIVDGLELTIPDSKITCIIGPNGCGKSTILKTIARLLKPSNGSVLLDGKAIHQQSTKSIAKKIAILAQSPHTPEEMTVKDLVSYGRSPYQKGFGQLSGKDWEMIHWALKETNLLEYADRYVHALSGGQRSASGSPWHLLRIRISCCSMNRRLSGSGASAGCASSAGETEPGSEQDDCHGTA